MHCTSDVGEVGVVLWSKVPKLALLELNVSFALCDKLECTQKVVKITCLKVDIPLSLHVLDQVLSKMAVAAAK